MSKAEFLPGGITVSEGALPKEVNTKFRAAVHIRMGQPDITLSSIQDASHKEVWSRLRDYAEPISPEVLWTEGKEFFSVVRRAEKGPLGKSGPLARYLLGAWNGLQDARGAYIGKLDVITRTPVGKGSLSRQALIKQLAGAEANFILTSNGYPSVDRRKIINPEHYLGEIMAVEYVLGRIESIPTQVPAVPEYLR